MVMYAEGWRPVYVLLFVAMCCPQSRRFWAFGRDRSQVDNSAAHPTSARNEGSTKRARELFRQGADLIERTDLLQRFLYCTKRRIWTLRRLESITISAMPFGKRGNGVQRQP